MNSEEHNLEHIRTVRMTAAEREAARHILRAGMASYAPSARTRFSPFLWARRHVAMASVVALLLLIGGAGATASHAGPGDALYGFRVVVNDNVESALAFNEDAQIDIQSSQIDRLLADEDVRRDQELPASDVTDSAAPTANSPESEVHATDDQSSDLSDELFDRELKQLEEDLRAEENATADIGAKLDAR